MTSYNHNYYVSYTVSENINLTLESIDTEHYI